jgi:hypothetical protein
MKPLELRTTLQALRSSDHAFKGVRPADATPAEAPAFLLEDDTVGSLDYAASAAADYWPACSQWALIAGDEQLADQSKDWPPGLHALNKPVTLATFSGRTGV